MIKVDVEDVLIKCGFEKQQKIFKNTPKFPLQLIFSDNVYKLLGFKMTANMTEK